MAFFSWTEKMETGVKVIDQDHHSLVDSINALAEIVEEGGNPAALSNVIGNLVTFVDTHFTREEAIMRQYGYDGYMEHKERHRTMRLFVHSAGHVIRENPDFIDLEALLEVLRTWLNHHILYEDMDYVPCVRDAAHFHPDSADFPEDHRPDRGEDETLTITVPKDTAPTMRHIATVLRDRSGRRFLERQLDELSNRQIEDLDLENALVHIAPITMRG